MHDAMTCAKVPDTGLSPDELGRKVAGHSTFPSPRDLSSFLYIPAFGW